jgi:hypothetical protein
VCLFPTLIVGIDIGFVTCFFPFFPGSFFGMFENKKETVNGER